MDGLSSKNQRLIGTFYFSGKSRPYGARLDKVGQKLGIELNGDEGGFYYELSDITLSEALGNLPRRIVFANGDAFESADKVHFEHIFRAQQSGFSRAIHQLEANTKLALLALLMVPLLAYGALIWVMPMAATRLASSVPAALVQQLDDQILASMEGYLFADTQASQEQLATLQQVWAQLPHGARYTLLVKDGGIIGANAMALPGGTVIVTDQLLEILQPYELLAVLAHETGHVELQHGLRNIIQSLGVTMVFSTIIGDVSMLAESALVAAPVVVQQMSYSKDMEREADAFARQQLAALGVSPACLGSALQRLVKSNKQSSDSKHKWQDYLSTHPRVDERVASAQGSECGSAK
jgi:Zn-dependent protease with chaperone function